MMPYRTKLNRTFIFDSYFDIPAVTQITVYDDDSGEWIGLYDDEGNPLFRFKDPIGY